MSAPETVHWAITYRCESRCPDCYVERIGRRFTSEELDTHKALRVVEVLAEWGVFQLALGGGEPLERPDLVVIARHAHTRGLVVHVTTGRSTLSSDLLEELAAGVTVLQFGIRPEALLGNPEEEVASLTRSVETARNLGLRVGANLMLSNTVLRSFEQVIELLAQAGVKNLTLLRYKPPAEVARWERENPTPETMRHFERSLPKVRSRYPEISLRVDCAASFLQRHRSPAAARQAGIRGCVAGDRIMALAPNGRVFPCSQLVQPPLCAGNVLADDLQSLWSHSALMKKYRLFREGPTFQNGECSACRACDHCGGCRVFSPDGLGAEPECPAGSRAGRRIST